MSIAALISLALVGVYIWQDGTIMCPDGLRYTSGTAQPRPFHRRFCGWNVAVLQVTTYASLVALGTLMGSWIGAVMLMTLPGAWLLTTRPHTVDAPSMLAAWCASLIFKDHPYAAVLLSCLAGFVHERGPVYAALYTWHPLLLVGLVAVGWWRKPGPLDLDMRVGRGFVATLDAHRPDHDWLNWRQTFFALRFLPFFAAWHGIATSTWIALGISWATRLICTDIARLAFWAAPLLIRDMPDVPAWMVMVHALSFQRMC